MPAFPIPTRIERDNSETFGRVTGVHETNVPRTLNLVIEPDQGHFRLRLQCSDPNFFNPSETWEAPIPLTPAQLWSAIARCRDAWRSSAVDLVRQNAFLLQREWNFEGPQYAGLLDQVLPPLALAGMALFEAIFFPGEALADPILYARLIAIGEHLRKAVGTMWIRVTSDDFYAPWNLLYTRDLDRFDGHDAIPEGFWGYQNLVEHVPMPPRAGEPINRGQDLAAGASLRVALQLDEGIDAKLAVPCIAPVRTELARYSQLTVIERNQSADFGRALARGTLDEHFLYFCCHAQGEGDGTQLALSEAFLALTDTSIKITPAKMDTWLGQRLFQNGPVVFVNACQSGQMSSLFHRGFAPTFLNRRASAFIGSQTEVPAVVAGEFARRFFAAFFSGRRSVGQILWELRREFLQRHQNPLGLLYSVYRGADVMLPAALSGQ